MKNPLSQTFAGSVQEESEAFEYTETLQKDGHKVELRQTGGLEYTVAVDEDANLNTGARIV